MSEAITTNIQKSVNEYPKFTKETSEKMTRNISKTGLYLIHGATFVPYLSLNISKQ
jgi:hypothetical protein